MKKRGIILNSEHIMAILEDRKNQHRVIVNPQPSLKSGVGKWIKNKKIQEIGGQDVVLQYMEKNNPIGQPGDELFVKETCKAKPGQLPSLPDGVLYKADESVIFIENSREDSEKWMDLRYYGGRQYCWAPAVHMPEWAARIILRIKSVHVERLKEITEIDAIQEGVKFYPHDVIGPRFMDYMADASGYGHPDHDFPTVSKASESFFSHWQKINGPDSLDKNPWVWVLNFSVQKIKK